MSPADLVPLPGDYADLLESLKERVRQARTKVQRTVNTELIELYWNIGRTILSRQEEQGWGRGVIKRLAADLRIEFPEMTGLSQRNLQYMQTFAKAWAADSIAQQPVAQLPWGHITVLLDKIESQQTRDQYAAAAVQHGWSRNVLLNMMMNKTLERSGAAASNFSQQLAAPDSELAQQVAKDPYAFEFLGFSGEVAERDLEQALLSQIVETLQELGPGFAFVGQQRRTRRGVAPNCDCISDFTAADHRFRRRQIWDLCHNNFMRPRSLRERVLGPILCNELDTRIGAGSHARRA